MNHDLFRPFIDDHGCVVLDGGLATALESWGYELDGRLWSALLLRDAPDAIIAVHRAYLDAGADCITSAGYQASVPGFTEAGFSEAEAESMLVRASELAMAARDAFVGDGAAQSRPRPLVAASVGPYGAYLADGSEYDGRYEGVSSATLVRFHRERLDILARSGVDILACETVPSRAEVQVLVDLLSTLDTEIPAWISFACRDGATLHDGTPVEEVARLAAASARVVAVGVNCTAPEHVPEVVARIRRVFDGHVMAYPNSGGRYDATTGRWSEEEGGGAWLPKALEAGAAGADIIGGCCRIGPEDIAELRLQLGA